MRRINTRTKIRRLRGHRLRYCTSYIPSKCWVCCNSAVCFALHDAHLPIPASAVCNARRTPFPSMPVCFWGDSDGSKYRSAYFEEFEGEDVWAHGDYIKVQQTLRDCCAVLYMLRWRKIVLLCQPTSHTNVVSHFVLSYTLHMLSTYVYVRLKPSVLSVHVHHFVVFALNLKSILYVPHELAVYFSAFYAA